MKWIESVLLGIGIGTLVETFVFLSPVFKITLWESYSNFVKLIPIEVLNLTVVLGFSFIGIAFFLWLYEKRK